MERIENNRKVLQFFELRQVVFDCFTLFVDKSLKTSEKLLMCPSEDKQTCDEVREKQQQMLSLDEFIKEFSLLSMCPNAASNTQTKPASMPSD